LLRGDGLCYFFAVGFAETGRFISIGFGFENVYGHGHDDVGTGWVFEVERQCSLVYPGIDEEEFGHSKPHQSQQNPKDHLTNEDVVQLLNAQPLNHFAKPGKYDYCNSNYALLALIVERQTGIDFREFVKLRIMNPSGMKYSHLANFDSLGLVNYTVQGYDKKRVFADNIFNGAMGDKGVYANVFEMLAMDRMLRTDYLLHPDTKNQMWAPQTVVSADAYYANGWRVKWINGQKWAFHNGWWKGFRTYYWRCLDEDKCFVVLTNNVQGPFLRTIDMVGLLK